MAQSGSSSKEYWRPANPEVLRLVLPTSAGAACWRCGTDYPTGARYCHICASERDPRASTPVIPDAASKVSDVGSIRRRFGLSIPSLVFFLLGLICMISAALTGMVYKTPTLVDWQAVQMWRIEWLLGAAAALLAGILLKKKSA